MQQHLQDKTPLRGDGFTFRQFFVAHDRCAMKVGTDGVLLGAWAPLRGDKILDIGCGSGLIALMLAQRSRSEVRIDAVEIDGAAAQQARENLQASPWAQRLRLYEGDVVGFAAATARRYSLIVSNPPYFPAGPACRSAEREQARYTSSLSHASLLECAAALLTPDGLFCLVLPQDIAGLFCQQACSRGWYVARRLTVADRASRPARRVLLALARQPAACYEQRLVIRDDDGSYSAAFQALTHAFYLFMPSPS
ncbi:tRNA1(Val) (adenine(37)-N6)-methyltransferase [Affinibrenneria salicis]|uniref:tRNA1(Val) (adenine(37)-N6)-methyltransferase n=1 Tax=Affinibrenneria salicis TaxID=2590031 RepID=A0A5J5FSA5_9GAMM|nr:tRNA1(Val) (adenine(37)-N6)-methyltransferase [Affinibrenneria salicis]KAA8995516.1 tRNA1(Val) (adenine(37)-N6)-methyltransferase [Affinibrenneria salicis]